MQSASKSFSSMVGYEGCAHSNQYTGQERERRKIIRSTLSRNTARIAENLHKIFHGRTYDATICLHRVQKRQLRRWSCVRDHEKRIILSEFQYLALWIVHEGSIVHASCGRNTVVGGWLSSGSKCDILETVFPHNWWIHAAANCTAAQKTWSKPSNIRRHSFHNCAHDFNVRCWTCSVIVDVGRK